MDTKNEGRDGQLEYDTPTVVDYGSLVEVTAVLVRNDLTDLPQGSPPTTS
jgi:hypothetical protein